MNVEVADLTGISNKWRCQLPHVISQTHMVTNIPLPPFVYECCNSTWVRCSWSAYCQQYNLTFKAPQSRNSRQTPNRKVGNSPDSKFEPTSCNARNTKTSFSHCDRFLPEGRKKKSLVTDAVLRWGGGVAESDRQRKKEGCRLIQVSHRDVQQLMEVEEEERRSMRDR